MKPAFYTLDALFFFDSSIQDLKHIPVKLSGFYFPFILMSSLCILFSPFIHFYSRKGNSLPGIQRLRREKKSNRTTLSREDVSSAFISRESSIFLSNDLSFLHPVSFRCSSAILVLLSQYQEKKSQADRERRIKHRTVFTNKCILMGTKDDKVIASSSSCQWMSETQSLGSEVSSSLCEASNNNNHDGS